MPLEQRWHDELEELKRLDRYRRLAAPTGVDFSSNDYLSLGKSPLLAAPRPPVTSGTASRLLRGQHTLWQQVEAELAAWHKAEAALVFSSGYAANQGLLSTIATSRDVVFSDEANHASIIDGLRLSRAERVIFRHGDLNHLEAEVKRCSVSRRTSQEMFVVVESLYSMEADRAPLAELAGLCTRHGVSLIVDEAHATGCFGREGAGLVDELGLRDAVLATVHTGGKALGVMGGYVCGSQLLKELLVNKCRPFIFTTALPPAVAQWWLARLPQVRSGADLRKSLHANARFFRSAAAEAGWPTLGTDYIVPFVLGDDAVAVKLAQWLQDQGLDVRAIRPPTVPAGAARLRVSIHADHDEATLRQLAEVLAAKRRV